MGCQKMGVVGHHDELETRKRLSHGQAVSQG